MNKNNELLLALAVTIATQVFTAMALFATPVLAPAASVDVGVAANAVGVFVSLMYVSAAFAAPIGGTLVARFGAVGMSQIGLLLGAAGIALFGVGHPLVLVLAAFAIGAGYGSITPASSVLLIERTPERARNVIMSIRQTGVPIGGALAGAMVPWIIVAAGWREASFAIAAACVLVAVLLHPSRRRFDAPRAQSTGRRPSIADMFRLVMAHPELARVSIASLVFSGIQTCFSSYLVVVLIEKADRSIVAAGALLSAAMIAGIAGRILWGVAADVTRNARGVLAVLGIVTAACMAIMVVVSPGWPAAALLALAVIGGLTAIGWNGVFLAEVARIAPQGKVAHATGAALMFTYTGPATAPFLFWLLLTASGDYIVPYLASAAVMFAASVWLVRR